MNTGSGNFRESSGRVVARVLLIGGIVAILATTLWPFTLEFRRLTWAEYVTSFALAPSTVLDLPRNILLFMPIGFGLASLLDRHGRSHGATLLLTLLTGCLVTACIESF